MPVPSDRLSGESRDDPLDVDPNAFEQFAGGDRLHVDGGREGFVRARRDGRLGDPQDALREPAVERPAQRDGRARHVVARRPPSRDRSRSRRSRPGRTRPARLEGSEGRRQHARDRRLRTVGEAASLGDRHRRRGRRRCGGRGRRWDRRGRPGRAVGVGVGVAAGVGAGVGVGVGVGPSVSRSASGSASASGVAVGVGVGVGVGDRRGRRVGVGVGVGVGTGVGPGPGTGAADIDCGEGTAWTIQSATLSFVSIPLPAEPPGNRSRLEPAGGAGAAASLDEPVGRIAPADRIDDARRRPAARPRRPSPRTRSRTSDRRPARRRPAAFAMRTRRPGGSSVDAVQVALRVTVEPDWTSRRRPRGRPGRRWRRPGSRSRRTRPTRMRRPSGPRTRRAWTPARPTAAASATGRTRVRPGPGSRRRRERRVPPAGRDPWLTSRRDTGRRVVTGPLYASLSSALIGRCTAAHRVHPVRCPPRPSRRDRRVRRPPEARTGETVGPRQEDRSRRSAPPPSSRDRRGGRDRGRRERRVPRGQRRSTCAPAHRRSRPPRRRVRTISMGTAFRQSFHPVDVRADLASLPWLVTHTYALWVPLAITVVGGIAVAVVNDRATLDLRASCTSTSCGRRPSVACSSPASWRRGRAGCSA